jgi:hypothetical protein
MTPKEKAKEIYDKFYPRATSFSSDRKNQNDNAKECAIIAIDEILESQPRYPSEVDWDDCGATHEYYGVAQREEAEKFWQEVKTEIHNL